MDVVVYIFFFHIVFNMLYTVESIESDSNKNTNSGISIKKKHQILLVIGASLSRVPSICLNLLSFPYIPQYTIRSSQDVN